MRHIVSTFALSLSLSLAVPALAKSTQSFESSVTTQVATPIQVEVVIGEDLAYRAENLPKKLSDRGNGRINSGFGNNGYYGERDLNKLAARLEKKMQRQLTKRGAGVSDDAGTVLRLVITDARPTRPTFRQLSKEPGLSYRSFGTGGATIEGQLIASDGTSLGDLSYAWYEDDIRDAAFGGTWTDANRALDRFARKTAKSLSE